jgi:hypothetical protein
MADPTPNSANINAVANTMRLKGMNTAGIMKALNYGVESRLLAVVGESIKGMPGENRDDLSHSINQHLQTFDKHIESCISKVEASKGVAADLKSHLRNEFNTKRQNLVSIQEQIKKAYEEYSQAATKKDLRLVTASREKLQNIVKDLRQVLRNVDHDTQLFHQRAFDTIPNNEKTGIAPPTLKK